MKQELMTVTWIDARSRDGYFTSEEIADGKGKPIMLVTTGWGITTKEGIVLGRDFYLPEDKTDFDGCRDITTIPWECVKDLRVYGQGKRLPFPRYIREVIS